MAKVTIYPKNGEPVEVETNDSLPFENLPFESSNVARVDVED